MNIDKIKNANTKILGKNVIYYDEISSTQEEHGWQKKIKTLQCLL